MGMQLSGDQGCMMQLLGSMEVVKTNLIDRMLDTHPELICDWKESPSVEGTAKPDDLQAGKHTLYSAEQEVPRADALAAYYKAIDVMRERISKIAAAPEGSSWVINPAAIASL